MGQGYPVASGLCQSAVNDKAGAPSPLALMFASIMRQSAYFSSPDCWKTCQRRSRSSPSWCSLPSQGLSNFQSSCACGE
ncbi:hypothetical protein [Ensifer sp. YR511]|uniref:hypothetical protein n=1 Tax=Ensifer sp. YR511 TaxID=1855294 RepID=UPI00352C8B30